MSVFAVLGLLNEFPWKPLNVLMSIATVDTKRFLFITSLEGTFLLSFNFCYLFIYLFIFFFAFCKIVNFCECSYFSKNQLEYIANS